MSTAKSSGLIAASTTVVKAAASRLNSVSAISDGTNIATVVVYDNASAGTGTVLAKAVATANCPTVAVSFKNPVRADNGITVVVSGTGSGAVLSYDA